MSLLNIHAHMTFDIVLLWDARRDVDNTISNLWLAHCSNTIQFFAEWYLLLDLWAICGEWIWTKENNEILSDT